MKKRVRNSIGQEKEKGDRVCAEELVAAKERHEKDLAAVRADFEHSAVTAKATFDRELANRDARITQLENSLNAVVRDKNSYSEQAQIRQAEVESSQSHLQL
ncbi:hypothetical protein DFJ43DRAFT_1169102 [Lentinula guzmanii]|uniref:Uncharacterized protein n=1 Tax=Lentinula guzmanii TaxID=2804957 RepID=A0AA38J2E9_9AGAR|nr:hypothetical protein DFJ43DRAFT_1169102 [Lentinula guzmanii]